MRTSSRCAFTLVELLVVIAIIGILISLTFPAIQAARESGRRTTCANNIKQFVTASHLYEESRQYFPPGYLGPTVPGSAGPLTQSVGTTAFLLQFMELSMLSDKFHPDMLNFNKSGPAYWADAGTWNMAQVRVNTFLCPSRNQEGDNTSDVFAILHTQNPATLVGYYFSGQPQLGRTNYLAAGGAIGRINDPYWDQFQGIHTNRSYVNFSFSDGSSNTISFGEYEGYFGGATTLSISMAWIGAGQMPTYWGLPKNFAERDWYRFHGNHPNITMFAFADGHVRPISNVIAQAPFIYLSGIKDKQPVDIP